MRVQRIAAVASAAIVFASGLTFTATSAQGATTVVVNCATSSAENFTVSPDEQIIFDLGPVGGSCQTMISAGMTLYGLTFQEIVERMAVINTGGNVVADSSGASWTVTYTAGSNPGTDSLDVSQAGLLPRALSLRIGYGTNDYTMTLPGGDGPPPWLQAYGRAAGATCQAGWNPSWAEWPNNHTGGFVCVRNLVYNNSTGGWDARSARR